MSVFATVAIGSALSALGYNEMPFYDTLPEWTLEWTDATHGTIATDQAHGGWKIHVARDGSRYGGYSLTIYNPDAKRSVIDGSGYLDLRGTITGPCFVNPDTNAVYKIGAMKDSCLRANDGSNNGTLAGTVKGLFTPGTITAAGLEAIFHNDGNPKTPVEDVYVVEPSLTTLPDWLFSGCTSFKYVVFDCAAMTTIRGPICNCGGPQGAGRTVFDEWNLPSVTQAGVKSNQAGSFAGWGKATGTLKLPSAQRIEDSYAFYNTGMGGLLLGARGQLEYVGSNAFSSCSALTNVVLGAAPAGKRLSFGTSAFQSANLKRVWFNGDQPPTFTPYENTYTFGTSATAEGAITFYVRDTPGWAEILAEADANGGLVAASRFDTRNRQRVVRFDGFIYRTGDAAFPIFDPRFAEKFDEKIVVASADFPYTQDGLLAFPITLSASCSDEADELGRKAHFHRWDGVPVELERQPTCTLHDAGEVTKIRPMFVHDWFYDATEGTIANGIWTINVTVVSSTARTLRIGSTSGTSVGGVTKSTAFRGPGYGEGILDFNGDVRDAQGNAWTITATSGYCMTKLEAAPSMDKFKKSDYTYLPTVVVFPETLTAQVGNEFNFNNSRGWPLDEVIFIVPEYAGDINWTLNGANDMKRLQIRAPRLTTIKVNAIWQGPSLSETDVTTWDLSGVTTVERGAFQCGTGMGGVLSLPSLRTVGDNNFKNYSKIEGVVLATNLTLTSVGTNVFNNCAAMKTVVIGNAKSGCTVGEASFANATKPASVTFLGKCNSEAADRVLSGTAATDGAKTVTLYASSALGWERAVAQPVGDEAASMPAGARGVYREGSRKAWYVDCPSPFDPRGVILLVR